MEKMSCSETVYCSSSYPSCLFRVPEGGGEPHQPATKTWSCLVGSVVTGPPISKLPWVGPGGGGASASACVKVGCWLTSPSPWTPHERIRLAFSWRHFEIPQSQHSTLPSLFELCVTLNRFRRRGGPHGPGLVKHLHGCTPLDLIPVQTNLGPGPRNGLCACKASAHSSSSASVAGASRFPQPGKGCGLGAACGFSFQRPSTASARSYNFSKVSTHTGTWLGASGMGTIVAIGTFGL